MCKLFSIIIPVYNVETYLKECVESVLSQQFSSYEILLVDDGSTDFSGQICDAYAAKYPQIQVFHQKNGGLSEARNTGIRNSKGEYLVFIDSDDKIYPDSLRHLQNVIVKQNRPDFIISRRCTWRNNDLIPCNYHFDMVTYASQRAIDIYTSLQTYPDCWLGVWIFTVKRSYSEKWKLLFYPGILHEDEEWVPRLFFHTNNIGFNNDLLYCNRVERAGSITATPTIKHEFDRLRIIDLLMEEFQKDEYDANVRKVMKKRIQQIYFGVLCQARLYRKDEKYSILLDNIKKHQKFMISAERRIYQIANYSINILGIERTCQLLLMLDKVKNKRNKKIR